MYLNDNAIIFQSVLLEQSVMMEVYKRLVYARCANRADPPEMAPNWSSALKEVKNYGKLKQC